MRDLMIIRRPVKLSVVPRLKTRRNAVDFSRAALIAEAEKTRPNVATDELEILRVHLFGSMAVAEGSEIWSEGGHQTRIVWSDLWAFCGEKWRLVTSTSRGSKVD